MVYTSLISMRITTTKSRINLWNIIFTINTQSRGLDTHSCWGDSSLGALKPAAFVRMGGGCRLVVRRRTDEWLAEGTSMDQSGSVCEINWVGDKNTAREHNTKHKDSSTTGDITVLLVIYSFLVTIKNQFTSIETRSEERRVGKECLRLCRSRWSPYH